jgi:hypothetical protein
MKKIVYTILVSFQLLFMGSFILLPQFASAADSCGGLDDQIKQIDSSLGGGGKATEAVKSLPRYCNIFDILQRVLDILFSLAGAVGAVMIVYGGIRYITSGASGGEKAAADAKNIITWAVIGLIVVFMARALVNIVINAILGK